MLRAQPHSNQSRGNSAQRGVVVEQPDSERKLSERHLPFQHRLHDSFMSLHLKRLCPARRPQAPVLKGGQMFGGHILTG